MLPTKIILFDCDETLWCSIDKDFISSIPSTFKEIGNHTLVREKDNKKFTLKSGVLEAFKYLSKDSHLAIGIISDNKPEPVIIALKLFNIMPYVDNQAFSVKLWKGYCPKHKMILEILNKKKFSKITPKDIYLFDDKDYSKEASEIGINYIRVDQDTDLLQLVKKIK